MSDVEIVEIVELVTEVVEVEDAGVEMLEVADVVVETLEVVDANQPGPKGVKGDKGDPGDGTVYVTRVHEVSLTQLYFGEAEAGSVDGDAVWRIRRVTTVGDLVETAWADGDAEFDNVWDDHLDLDYS